MKKFILITLLVFTFTGFLYSQNDNTLFENNFRMTGAWSGVGVAMTKMSDQTIGQFTSSTILEYNNSLLLGYEWRSNFNELILPASLDNGTYKFGYSSYLIGYNYKSNQILHPKMTVGIGHGSLNVNGNRDKVFVMQPALGLEINLLQWARLSFEGSYRHVTKTQTIGIENKDLSGFLGAVILRFGWSW